MSNTIPAAAEYDGLIRQELDIESLLRTTLEFILGRSGPTNGAIFLPTTAGDFSLGAYVNYDCPKDTADILLDHLANAVAPRFADRTDPLHIKTPKALDKHLGRDADWVGDCELIAHACEADGETLAVVILFRDRRSPYAKSLPTQLTSVGRLFAEQLARVIKIHHRHLPKEQWGAIGDAEEEHDDWGDMAA